MKIKNIVLVIIIAAIALGIALFSKQHNSSDQALVKAGHHDLYYCPMHPQIIYDHPGRCPICGMDLVKKEASSKNQGPELKGYTTISVTDQKQQLIGLRTVAVEVKPVVKIVRTFGVISSPAELYKVQNEFIDAYVAYVNVHRNYKRINDRRDSWGIHRDIQVNLLEAKDKLLKLGLGDKEITKLQDVSWNQIGRQPRLLLFNESQNYWVMAQIFEQDYSSVKEGQEVRVGISALHEEIKGTIRSIGGFIDPANRSVTALIELGESNQQLAANMLVDITIPVELGNAILVPREAVMDTGLRKIIFVKKDEGTFEPREIKTGMETEDGYEVIAGLKAGESIVVNGNFLLDSESRVQAGLEQGESHE